MIDELEQEKLSILALIESWKKENVDLALQIMRGKRKLRALVKEHYTPMLTALFGKVDLNVLKKMPEKLEKMISAEKEIPYFPCLETLMPIVPTAYVYITDGKMTEIPWWVFKMPQLKELNMTNQKIKEIPEKIGELQYLEELNFTQNKLTKLPESIGNLINLKKLQLDFNKIEKLPDSIGNLKNLNWLCLEANAIKSLPKSAENLTALYWLSIEKTPLGKAHKITSGTYISVDTPDFKALLT
jgi:hypothetical protein